MICPSFSCMDNVWRLSHLAPTSGKWSIELPNLFDSICWQYVGQKRIEKFDIGLFYSFRLNYLFRKTGSFWTLARTYQYPVTYVTKNDFTEFLVWFSESWIRFKSDIGCPDITKIREVYPKDVSHQNTESTDSASGPPKKFAKTDHILFFEKPVPSANRIVGLNWIHQFLESTIFETVDPTGGSNWVFFKK